MAAIDTVCINCVEDTLRTKVCEYCPVRNLADSLNEKKNKNTTNTKGENI